MNHLTEEELILHFYGEADRKDEGRVEAHLASCDQCRASQASLRRVLHLVDTTPMPAARPGFERDVWARLEPQLDQQPRGWFSWRRAARDKATLMRAPQWALAGGVAVLVVAAFVAGRVYSPALPALPAQPFDSAQGKPAQVAEINPERVLNAAVGDHLDQSQMMLVELVNSGDHPNQLADDQARAQDLVAANRLYRQSAEQAGDAAIADILEELERVLLEIANAPSAVTPRELAVLKSRIEAQDLVFRVRVIQSEMRQRNKDGRETGGQQLKRAPIS